MPVTKVKSRWDSGNLIFHEETSLADSVNLLTIAPSMVTIGNASNDVDFKVFLGSTEYALFDYGDSKLTLSGVAFAFSGTQADEVIQIGGTYDHGIRFTEDMVAGDVTNSFINIGDYTTAIAVAPSGANMFGEVHNVTVAVNVAYWYQAKYTKISTSGTTTQTQIAGHALRLMVDSDLGAVYGIQSHVTITGARTVTGEVSAGSFYLNVGTGSSEAQSRINALQAVVTGSGTITGSYYVADFGGFTNVALDAILNLQTDGSSTATSGILMDIDGTVTYAIDFQGTVSDAWSTSDLTGSDELGGFDEIVKIPVRVAGISPTLYLLAAETWKTVTV